MKFIKLINNLEEAFDELSTLSFSFSDVLIKTEELRINKIRSDENTDLNLLVPMSIDDAFLYYCGVHPYLESMYKVILNINPDADIELCNIDGHNSMVYTTFTGKNKWIFKSKNPNNPEITVTWECDSKNGTVLKTINDYNDNHIRVWYIGE